MEQNLEIILLEDSSFYSKLLTKHIVNFMTDTQNKTLGDDFKIRSFDNQDDLIDHIDAIDAKSIFLLDFYLPHSDNSLNIIKEINHKLDRNSIAILSRFENFQAVDKTKFAGASSFIRKDAQAFGKIETFILNHLN